MGSVSSTITLVDQMSSALSSIESNVNSLKSSLKNLESAGDNLNGANFDGFIKSAEKAGKRMTEIGKEMSLALTAPILLLGKEMFGDAVEYESAFAGMTKTVEGTTEQYEKLNEIVLELSETTPSSYTELMGIAQQGGNFDVAIEDMETFLKSYSALQAATDQHINGEAGAESVAKFLNVTEGGVSGIERFSSAIVDLGNNYATTEDQILNMGNRMAAAAHLAGINTPEILGMAAAFSSVGINEEAGGSAASKFIKQMQLASEVGYQAQARLDAVGEHFASGMEFSRFLDSSKKGDIADLAAQLNMTTDAVRSMADSWVLMDQFAEVSGKTTDQFVKDWSTSPVQAMSDFFTGLSQLGENGGESILATLDKMGLTEIRESNLIAAMASRPELFASAIQTAVEAYGANTALWEEFGKQTSTQEAQNQMLANKLHNTMADFGDNLVKALQPALDMVNNILDAFNNLSEVDQSNILKGLAVIAALGPGLTIVGGALKAIAAAMQLISGHGKEAADAVQSVINAANGEGAAAETAAETGLSTGSKLAGGITLAAVAALFAEGAKYRAEHGAIGSVEAIQNAVQDNEALRNAFIEWVDSNNALNEAADAALNGQEIPDEKFNELVDRQEQAIKNFLGMEGSEVVKDLYNDWRDANNKTLDDWVLPEGFLSSFQTPEVETPETTIPEPVIQLPEVATPQAESGGMVVGMGFGFGFTQGVEAQTNNINMAANSLSTGAVESAVATLNNGAVPAASAAMSSAAVSAVEGILSSGAGSAIGRNFMAGLAAGIRSGGGAAIAAAAGVAASIKSIVSSILKIHSPSRVAYWQGEMTMLGFANGIDDGGTNVLNIVKSIFDDVKETWNDETWNLVGEYANTEAQALADTFNHVKDGVKVNDSDIKKIRTLAEREVINHFTTAEVKVEMTNNNNISSDMDIDGIIAQLEDKVTERLEAVAEGVYS